MDQVEMKDAVAFTIPGIEPIEANGSWSSSDADNPIVIKEFEKLKIKLTRPLKARHHSDDGYNLPVEGKGLALILSSKIKRDGSEKDIENLDKLLTLFGYKVSNYDTFYSDESNEVQLRLSTILEHYKSQITKDVKSIFVFVGSHGNFGSFQTSDDKSLDFLSDLVYKFSHPQCPQLIGKPKIFLAQLCQTFKDPVEYEQMRNSFEKFTLIEKRKAQKENDPVYIADTIICHSAIPGFEALRQNTIGSLFVHCFCKVAMENAHKLDLWSMMHPVGEEMQKFYRHKQGSKLTPTPTQYHAKKVYFNLAPNLHIIPEKLDIYINRWIKPGNLISGKILRHKCPDIFVFQLNRLNRVTLSNLIKDEVTTVSSECKEIIPARFIVLEEQHHFYKICEVAKETPVHLIQEVNSGEWKWIMSNGSVDKIQMFVKKPREFISEVKFLSNIYSSNLTQPICMVGRPGMGKSSLLAEIGRKLTIRYPERLILFIRMKHFVNKMKNMSGYNIQIQVQSTLRKLLRENHLDDEEFDQIICNGSSDDTQFELLLDGFDESEDILLAHQILHLIRRAYGCIRIWVTSRLHLQQDLEKTLEVSAFLLTPFNLENQLDFLSLFWFKSETKFSLLEGKAEEEIAELEQKRYFVYTLLMHISSRFSNNLADIPLQCMIIGSVYEEEAKEFMRSKIMPESFSKTSSIGNLFQSYISKCVEKYNNGNSNKLEGTVVEEMHARLALELGPESTRTELNLPLASVEMTDILKMGIVESADTPNCPEFIHAAFREYFLAWLPLHIMQILSEDNAEIKDKLYLQAILTKLTFGFAIRSQIANIKSSQRTGVVKIFRFSHSNIAYFFDYLLPNFKVPTSTQLIIEELSPELISAICASSLKSNYVNIFNFLNFFKQTKENGDKIFTNDLLYNAASNCNLDFFKLVLKKFEEFHKLDLRTKETLLIVATENGNYEVLEFLLNVRKLRFIVEKITSPDIRLLLHLCIARTEEEEETSEYEISQRIEILQKLVSVNSSLLEEKDDEGKTPLFCIGVHIRLLQVVIKLGANVLAQDNMQCNFLHFNFNKSHLTAEEYHTLVTSIPDEKLNELVMQKDTRDPFCIFSSQEYVQIFSKEILRKMEALGDEEKEANFGETPLMTLITRMDPLPETLQKFYEAGADFNCSNELKCSILAQAIMYQRSGEVIQKLIELGADINWRGWNGESLLHVAAYWSNVNAIRVLLDNSLNVNDEDASGRMPLDYTVESRHRKINIDFLEAGLELCDRGGKLIQVGHEGKPWLHIAVEEVHLEFVKLLLELVDVNEQDELENTAIHVLILDWIKTENYWRCEDFCKILNEFFKKDVNMECLNKDGETPTQLALKIKRMDFETFKTFLTKAKIEWTTETATLGLKYLVAASISETVFRTGIKELGKYQPNFSFVDEEGNSFLHLCVDNIKWKDTNHYKRLQNTWRWNGSENEKVPFFGRSWMSDLNIMKFLIKNGSSLYKKNKMDLTFLHALMLEMPGLSPTDFFSLTNYLDKKGCLDLFNIPGGIEQATPFQMAVAKVPMDEKNLAFFKARGMDFNALDKNGDSVLFYATKSTHTCQRLLPILIKFGADWNHRNNKKESLLHISGVARHFSIEPLKFMLEELKLDVNEKNDEGNTPVHCEILDVLSMEDKIMLLVESGADLTIQNNDGFTPLELARHLKKEYFVELLTKLSN